MILQSIKHKAVPQIIDHSIRKQPIGSLKEYNASNVYSQCSTIKVFALNINIFGTVESRK